MSIDFEENEVMLLLHGTFQFLKLVMLSMSRKCKKENILLIHDYCRPLDLDPDVVADSTCDG